MEIGFMDVVVKLYPNSDFDMKSILFLYLLFCHFLLFGQIDLIQIDEIVESNIQNKHFEGTVLIAKQGEILYQRSNGFADRNSYIPIRNETKFSIASITKLFTAIVILELVEEKELDLDQTLVQLLPNLNVPNADNITIHHLLLHISGLPNEPDIIYSRPSSPAKFITETMREPSNEVGAFNYTNIDYVLLGLVIEEITKESWQEQIEERIIKKLGMKNTGFLKKGNYPDDFAFTYSVSNNGDFRKDPSIYIENYFSAGNMFSTAEDLLILDQAMYSDILLSEKSKAKMFTSYPEFNYTGYSVWTYNYPFAKNKPLVMERRGGIMGANSVLMRMLDTKQTIIILSNNDKFNPDSFGDSNNLREALLLELSQN